MLAPRRCQSKWSSIVITKHQIRAARGLLGWTQGDLAEASNISRETLADFESGKRAPIRNNLLAILRAFESAGIRFLGESGVDMGSNRQ
jgi:transcriptional regulator with XRE-family HTH domain